MGGTPSSHPFIRTPSSYGAPWPSPSLARREGRLRWSAHRCRTPCCSQPEVWRMGRTYHVNLDGILKENIHLVGGWFEPEKYEFVNWDDEIPNIWENKKCSKPPTSNVHQCRLIMYIDVHWSCRLMMINVHELVTNFNLSTQDPRSIKPRYGFSTCSKWAPFWHHFIRWVKISRTELPTMEHNFSFTR